jgi:DNA-binding MarR family transcriptional regulator
MNQTTLARDSIEYLEILADVFAELVQKHEFQASDDITPSLLQCLQFIYLHGPTSIRKIAAGLSVTVPAASQLVDRLVVKELVTREHSKKDRRCANVGLTDEGKVMILNARSLRSKWIKAIVERMTEDHREVLVNSMEEFIRLALETHGCIDDACIRCGIDHLAFCVVSKARVSITGEQLENY